MTEVEPHPRGKGDNTRMAVHCDNLYAKFQSEAVKENDYLLWRGKLTVTARDIGIPDGVYKRVVDQLIDLGCIDQLARGVRGQPTVMLLHYAPTSEVWAEYVKSEGRGLTPRDTPAILSRRVSELERRLQGIDVKQAFVDLSEDIRRLEKVLKAVETQN